MQRKLILMRHAKTKEAEPGQTDYERMLTIRGLRNTTEMAEKLQGEKLIPDLIIASPARRTRQTAEGIAEVLGYDKDKIKWAKKLYNGTPTELEEVIYESDDAAYTIMIIAHNPGITDLLNGLSPAFEIDNMQTGAIAAANVDADKWSAFATANKQVFLYAYPNKES